MKRNKWLTLFMAGVVGIAVYLLTRPDPEDDGWSDIKEEDWWG